MSVPEYGIISINRKQGAKFKNIFNFKDKSFEKLLTLCLPFGDPHDKSIKLKMIDNVFYIVVLILYNKDEGIAIIAPINIKNKIFSFNRALINNLFNILKINANPHYFSEKTVFHSITSETSFNLLDIKHVENLIISIIVEKKIYILDSNFKFLALIEYLFILFPPDLHFLLEFVMNSNSFSENTRLISIPITNRNLQSLDKINKEKNTILDLDNNLCYGYYSSPLIEELINFISKNMISSATNILQLIFEKASQDENVNENVSKLSKLYKLNKADIVMILNLRKVIFNKSWNGNMFNELIN